MNNAPPNLPLLRGGTFFLAPPLNRGRLGGGRNSMSVYYIKINNSPYKTPQG